MKELKKKNNETPIYKKGMLRFCMGEALLWAEARLGELLKQTEFPQRNPDGTFTDSLPEGITKKQSHFAQTLADHPEEIREVIEEAKENEDIPKVFIQDLVLPEFVQVRI